MTKKELINLIMNLPEDIDVFNYTNDFEVANKMMDIRISLEPKRKEFYDMYFGM